jgi:hypothetical protein
MKHLFSIKLHLDLEHVPQDLVIGPWLYQDLPLKWIDPIAEEFCYESQKYEEVIFPGIAVRSILVAPFRPRVVFHVGNEWRQNIWGGAHILYPTLAEVFESTRCLVCQNKLVKKFTCCAYCDQLVCLTCLSDSEICSRVCKMCEKKACL